MNCFDFRSALKSLLCTLALSSLLLVPSARAQKPNILTWGENVSSWKTALGVTQMHESCTYPPSECEPYLEQLGAEQSSTGYYYVSFISDPSTAVTYAEDFSKLSLTYKHMLEIDFDDFIGKLKDLQVAGELPNPNAFVNSVITAAHYYNSNLAFGVTIYEDNLTSGTYTNSMLTTTLTAATRARIQYIHLFVHYRENSPKFATYVAQAKYYFPNAKIIGGNYPYDRIDYIPCAYGGTAKCTPSQEQSYHQQLLQIESSLLKSGALSAIEAYFGYFGMPQDWPGWTAPHACTTRSYTTCIDNTSTLHSITKSVIQSEFSGSSSSSSSTGTGAITYQSGLVNVGSEPVGEVKSAVSIPLTNTGSGPVTFTALKNLGSNPGDFQVTNNCPDTLAAGKSCSLFVKFQPHAKGLRGEVFIWYDGSSHWSVDIEGTGE